MGSILRKLNELLLRADEDEAQTIRQLRDGVATIGTKLAELSEVHDPPLTVTYWMRDARELSYDMEDCVDLFVVHANSDARKKTAWVDEVSGFRTRVEEVMERYHRFNLEHVLITSRPQLAATKTAASHRLRQQMASDEDHNTVAPVGMEGPRAEIVTWLKPKGDDEKELQLKVVSILGVEGVGKSTLAQELWRTLGEDHQFECRAFVKASKKPNMRMILRSILLQVRPNQQLPEACRVPDLIHDITKHLQDKRYFIIIDDLWAVSVWDTVSRAFPEGNCCSRIVTTTTLKEVALACCSYDPENIFKMKSLSHGHSTELFVTTVFGSGKECPQKFHDVSDEITEKCGGLPLAIICIATLVSSKPEAGHQWEYIQNFLLENLRTNPTSVEILKQVLNLCYSSLPHCLKTCLLYLSVYPENYFILKEDLVKQWIAEDFICAKEEDDIVEVASSYFDELVSLGLIQRMDINRNKKGLHYVVHPTVFEFITCKSMEDNFITVIDYSQSTVALTEKIRRLSLHFGSATYATIPESMARSEIRSLSFMGLLNCMPSLANFKLVRVMILHVLVDNGEKSFPLTGIGGLLFLRYLQVRCNVTVQLPEEIGCLKHLETLEIQRVAAVPSEIVCLASFKMKRFDRVDGEYDPLKKNWIHEMRLSNERDDVVKILHAVSKEDLSNDQPAGVVGKMLGDDDLSNDQRGGVLGKMPWEDDLPNDQPAGALGNMPGDDALSNGQPGGVVGKMPGDDDLSNDQRGGVLGKMPCEDDLSNDQPRGVLGKMISEDDLPNDQSAGVLGKMPWEDDISNGQPGGVLGNMEGEHMNKYDAYTRCAL
ncbi:disease resistance protein RGA5-like [Panicum virgatum]|uniref:disease resistance protein RGA5-like n=1 Tax=Panicum virgatum TaxID=38727 RepID=UPI0019D64E90|nr:disease resistance protein RGA5-like [Panicum virgatum]